MNRIFSFVVLVAVLLLIGVLFFRVIAGLLLPLFLALVLVVMFRPLYLWMVKRCKGRTRVAAVITTSAVLLSVLLPVSLVLAVAGVEMAGMITEIGRQRFGEEVHALRKRFSLVLPSEADELDEAVTALADDAVALDSDLRKDRIDRTGKSLDRLKEKLAGEVTDDAPKLEHGISVLQAKLGDFATADPHSEEFSQSLTAVQEAYFAELRPKLVRHFVGSRFHTWLVLQANPTRQQLEELRGQALQLLGLESLGGLAVSTGTAVGKALIGFGLGLFIMTVSLYYFLADGPEMMEGLMRLSPLDRRHVARLLGEFDQVSRAVVLATLLAAVAQGVLAGIGYWLTGFDSVFLLTFLTMVLAMVPFVGATAIWLPCCLWLAFIEQRPGAAIALAIYGTAVVSVVDNFVKPLVLHGQSNLHPLFALLSVLGGVQALGPIGIFVGPMAVAFLQALLQMLQGELKEIETTGKEVERGPS